MDPVPRGALTNRAACQSIPLLCGPVGRFLIGADLKGESNVTLMKGMQRALGLFCCLYGAQQQLSELRFSIQIYKDYSVIIPIIIPFNVSS